MKNKFLIIAVILLTGTSCGWNWGWNWDVDKEVKTTNQEQKIQGPADCITNEWSWNNGVATVGGTVDGNYRYFTFCTSISGVFTFDYSAISYGPGHLWVEINGKPAFEHVNFGSGWKAVDLGYLKSGVTVKFLGYECCVKDLIIIDK